MAQLKAIPQDPKVGALIGPYETLSVTDGVDEVWLGTEGAIWSQIPDEPVLWREVAGLQVSVLDLDDDGVYNVLEARLGPTKLAPAAQARIVELYLDLPGPISTVEQARYPIGSFATTWTTAFHARTGPEWT
jgi:hypothetical protein